MKKQEGYILIPMVIFAAISAYLSGAMVNWTAVSLKAGEREVKRESSIQIAEAGVDYYRWHLAQAPNDFQDGTGSSGPYVHEVRDVEGNVVGEFALEITPPPLGTALVGVESIGAVDDDTSTDRKVAVRFGKRSIAKYAVAANDAIRFGEGTEVTGPVHSNNGVRFDGFAHNVVTSSATTYDDPDHSGGNEFGVHTHVFPVDPLPPSAVPNRPDVFETGRQFPVEAVDFVGITTDLLQMRTDAQSAGFYRPSAGALGYHVVLRTDDTFDLYRVTNLVNAPSGCTNSASQTGWGTWSIGAQQLIGNYSLPTNGIIFLEDDVFVDGQVDGARLTIIAAFLPDNVPLRKNIIVNSDLLYSSYDGSDAIGLIAQGNISVGMVSDNDLRIDAALIAQNGRVGRYYYAPPSGNSQRCSPYHARQEITLWGMIASYQRYGFAYTGGLGYLIRNINYDGNLLYGPPPSFPLTSEEYISLTWDEE